MKVSFLIVLTFVSGIASAKTKGQRNPAQDPPRFAPPRPPPLDQDFEDPDEEFMENGDAPSRAQNPPPGPPPPVPNNFTPPPSFGNASGADSGKMKFKLAEGEFYEKGKKRGRTPNDKRSPQGQFRGGR